MAAWRPGNWLIAVHRIFTLRPRIHRDVGYFSCWWLWFEASYADAAKIDAASRPSPAATGGK